ncbi:MAG: UDP-N-acetylglucosamine pyrophosphorylase [Clostridium sp.]|nr:UDP-N-acetylglucosamine pyrophosphorylase [Clostridium sp.]
MKLEQMTIKELLDTSHTIAERLFDGHVYPWEVLPNIRAFIEEMGPLLPENEYKKIGKNIWIHKNAKIAPTIAMGGPMIVCAKAEVRQSAFLRGGVIIGEGAVIGNSCELKNVVIFDGAQVPHFNYVGDSILGYKAHMGAGAVTSNVKSDRSLVCVHAEDGDVTTGFKKFGAILGDGVEVGCNSVLNPGAVIGKNSNVYPLSSVRGCVPADSIYKNQTEIVIKEIREQEETDGEPVKGGLKIVK